MTRLTARQAHQVDTSVEDELALQLRAVGIFFERHVRVVPDRKWEFDFLVYPLAIPHREPIAVEVEGGTKFGVSRHSRGTGFANDARKYNRAALEGWTVLRFTTEMVKSGEALAAIERALGIEREKGAKDGD